MTRAALALALAAALLGGVWRAGVVHERGRWEVRVAELQAERDRHAARIMGLAEALEAAQAARAALATELEDAADADDDAGRVALPARSLRRIGAR